jgi:AcrR family transcriptional regulator
VEQPALGSRPAGFPPVPIPPHQRRFDPSAFPGFSMSRSIGTQSDLRAASVCIRDKLTTVIRKKRETRERIVAAAIELFALKGIQGVTVDDISVAADVGKGTIYNYFATKEDIVVAFLVDLERHVQQEVRALAHRRGSLRSILQTFVERQLALKEPHHQFVRVFLAQMYRHTEAFLPWMQQIQNVTDPPLRDLFSALRDRGLLRQDVDIDDLIMAFKVLQLGLSGIWAVEGPPWQATRRVVTNEIHFFCEGVGARK